MLAIVLALAVPARAETDERPAAELVTAAQQAFDQLKYDEALGLIDRAWHRGDSEPAQLYAIFALAGQAAGSMGDEDGARLWFSRWLSLDPEASLPPGTSPKLTALFGDARTALAGAKLEATAVLDGERVELTIVRDPLSLVERARSGKRRVRFDGGKATLPTADRIELLDRDGNVLAAIVPRPPGTTPSANASATVVVGDRPWFSHWATWAITAGGAVVIGGAALGVALDARSQIDDLNADSANHEFAETRPLARRFTNAQWVARFAFGAAAIAGGASLVFYVRGRGEQRAVVEATPGGATVSWRGSW